MSPTAFLSFNLQTSLVDVRNSMTFLRTWAALDDFSILRTAEQRLVWGSSSLIICCSDGISHRDARLR